MNIRSPTLLLALVLVAGCRADRSPDAARAADSGAGPAHEWFVDRAEETGLRFVHFNGMSGQWYYPEHLAPGVAMFDYDNDGDLDIFLVQGQMLGEGTALFPPQGPLPLEGRLFRNDLTVNADGTRTLRFTDVTDASGIRARGYGMGVATGDFNNDGCVDLYVTNLGRNQMFQNNCDGTFTDVSRQSGTDDPSWSVSASFLDFDRDGWLDLFVGNYLDYSINRNTRCFSPSGRPDYCSPNVYRAQPSRLYHNNRDGTFTDVTVAAGLAREFGPALGVATADFNGDGWIDIYVANDGQENQLWINQRDGTFKNTGLLSGSALSADGKPKASMGVDAGDFDNDGDEDLFMTELRGEGSNLFVNDGSGVFEERGTRSGLGPLSLAYTGFGTAWFDFDNDGWLDLLTVNGAVQTIEALARTNDPFPLHQRKQLFRNLGNGRFEEVTDRAGAVFQLSEVGRGAAFGDIDNDGDVDVLVANNNGRVRLLINELGGRQHWLGLRLVGTQAPRDMLGARVEIMRTNRADGAPATLWRRARADGSYASANDPRVLVGLGGSAEPVTVRVWWPSGRPGDPGNPGNNENSAKPEEWTNVGVDRYTTLKEGSGK
jgi:enediyne biosynthesis protein E4